MDVLDTEKIKKEWDLSPLFKRDDDPNILEARKRIEQQIRDFSSKWKSRRDYLENAAVLKQALEEYESLEIVGGDNGEDGGQEMNIFISGLNLRRI